MILSLHSHVHDAILRAARQAFSLDELPAFAVETPPSRAFGDLAVPVAFQLARTLKKPPRAIAHTLVETLGTIPGISQIVAAPNGYLNFYLDRPGYLLALVASRDHAPAAHQKTIVEHTAINPNKAAHVGHLRNAALGDTLSRVLRFRGTPVEVQNYIDDTGVQVADVIVGFLALEQQTLDGIRHIADTTRFDYYCWDLYSRVTEWYDGDNARLDIRARTLHDLEAGHDPVSSIGTLIVDRIVRAHLKTMARLNIAYDLLTYEGDILRLKFWAHAFDILKAQGAVFLQTEGKLAGCWVMRIEDGQTVEGDDEEAREKVIVRSNGVVTYVGKDIANQFWKFGLLGRDFRYRRFLEQANGQPLWATTSAESEPGAPPFGKASRIYNVIDSRQMYLQALLSQALRTLGHPVEADRSIHFSYEMVALSHTTARELGYPPPVDEDAKKPFVEVSGRKGLGVKIDDLLDLLTDKALAEVTRRNPEASDAERQRTASQIAVAAIRYFMLKFSRGKLIVFDMEEALSFEGETGPYLQYAVVRANNIFGKLKERESIDEAAVLSGLEAIRADEIVETSDDATHDLWALVFEASRLDDIVEQTVRALEFSVLAKYAFGLAQLFNAFYHRFPILNEEDAARRRWRAAGVAYFRMQLTRALDLMGIEVPGRM
ncbi:MAG: arginine--tRNA ligase [Acidobacteriaceae bacterium]|jgi:arginyl-tRNA synthetase|nr:arginine--tRNA ligase [Acidobacteriaceae bacterium]